MADPRRVAILGAGIGAAHLAAYLELRGRFRVTQVCDLDPARAAPLLADADAAFTERVDQVLADRSVDLVDICLPPHLHAPVAIAALDAGKDVICEKPLVPSLAEVDRLAEAAQRAGRRVFPVFQYRFGAGASRLKALVAAGLAGTAYVATLETHWNRGADYYATGWRGTWAGEQGGALLSHAIHAHDWLGFVLGPVASVHAEAATRVNPIETEDCAALSIRLESGAVATSSVTLGAASDTSRYRFVFEGLTAESGTDPYAPATGSWQFTARDPKTQPEIDRVLAHVPECRSGFAGFLDAVADALAGHGGKEVTLAEGRRSIEFVTAAYASVRAAAPVVLPLSKAHPLYEGWGPGSGAATS